MSALVGVWALESSENLNEYLRQLGMSLAKRKTDLKIEPRLIISKSDDDMWHIEIDMKSKGTETLFKEGQQVDTSNELKFVFDSRYYFDARRKCVSSFKFENINKLIQTMKFTETNEIQTIVREVNDQDLLIESLEMNGVTATRLFKRIE